MKIKASRVNNVSMLFRIFDRPTPLRGIAVVCILPPNPDAYVSQYAPFLPQQVQNIFFLRSELKFLRNRELSTFSGKRFLIFGVEDPRVCVHSMRNFFRFLTMGNRCAVTCDRAICSKIDGKFRCPTFFTSPSSLVSHVPRFENTPFSSMWASIIQGKEESYNSRECNFRVL